MQRCANLFSLFGMVACLAISAIAQEQVRTNGAVVAAPTAARATKNDDASATHSTAASTSVTDKERAAVESALRTEGEKRFRSNCGRCHMAPHKFPPRVMATAIRHMRVRAMLTEEDMRLILRYMTQ